MYFSHPSELLSCKAGGAYSAFSLRNKILALSLTKCRVFGGKDKGHLQIQTQESVAASSVFMVLLVCIGILLPIRKTLRENYLERLAACLCSRGLTAGSAQTESGNMSSVKRASSE